MKPKSKPIGQELAVLNHRTIVVTDGKFKENINQIDVEVMARAKGYAMVRRKGCAPFVASVRDLLPIAK